MASEPIANRRLDKRVGTSGAGGDPIGQHEELISIRQSKNLVKINKLATVMAPLNITNSRTIALLRPIPPAIWHPQYLQREFALESGSEW